MIFSWFPGTVIVSSYKRLSLPTRGLWILSTTRWGRPETEERTAGETKEWRGYEAEERLDGVIGYSSVCLEQPGYYRYSFESLTSRALGMCGCVVRGEPGECRIVGRHWTLNKIIGNQCFATQILTCGFGVSLGSAGLQETIRI